MTQLSNDVKWNKLQEIIESILPSYQHFFYTYWINTKATVADKKANTKVWELANKIYDIATEGFYEEEYFPYSRDPISYAEYVADCNRLALDDWGRNHTSFVRSQIKEYRDDYDYSNS